jgi:hypothetical protein
MTVYGISGGPIAKFREGWALLPFFSTSEKPHYWKRRGLEKIYDSLCGHTYELPLHPGVQPLDPGVFMVDRCNHCRRKRDREVRS